MSSVALRVTEVEQQDSRPQLELLVGQESRLPKLLNTPRLQAEYVEQQRALWMYMKSEGRTCFTPQLLADILAQQDEVAKHHDAVDFFVMASATPGVFNLGGDLNLFRRLVAQGDQKSLMDYATVCIDCIYNHITGFDRGTVTIALLEGEALGGGLEAALSCHIVVAERGVRMGFPELLFNLFPGMGAYSLVARKAGPRVADELITSGKILTAEEMHELGLVDYLAEPGYGEAMVRKVMAERRSNLHGYRAYQRAKRRSSLDVTYEELIDITKEWVAAAFTLADRDLRMMERLVRAQDKKAAAA